MNTLTSYIRSSIGRKTIVAVTGLLLLLFVIGHLSGNLLFYLPAEYINEYSHKLHALGAGLQAIRIALLIILVLHVAAAVSLTRENRKARTQRYAVAAYRASTTSSRTMIMTGALILFFVLFHLLHYTARNIDPEIIKITKTYEAQLASNPEALYPVKAMMIAGFSRWYVSVAYIIAMLMLTLHLNHGIQSLFQTLGLRTRPMSPFLSKTGHIVAGIIFLGFISIPISVLLGLVK